MKKRDSSAIATLVGAGTTLTGDLGFRDGLHVDGRIVGDVAGQAGHSSRLTVSPSGVIEGAVMVDDLVLNGTIKGDVLVRDRAELGASAQVDGNLTYSVLEMAAGARVNGRLIHHADGPEALPPLTASRGDEPEAEPATDGDGVSGLR